MLIYPAICHFEDGEYWCEFPDLPGCFSQGATDSEIVANAREALGCHLESYLEKGEPLPKPTKITDIKVSGQDFATYVSCDIENTGKSVRKNVTLPEWLCRRAEKASVNFSQTLQESLIKKLGVLENATA